MMSNGLLSCKLSIQIGKFGCSRRISSKREGRWGGGGGGHKKEMKSMGSFTQNGIFKCSDRAYTIDWTIHILGGCCTPRYSNLPST